MYREVKGRGWDRYSSLPCRGDDQGVRGNAGRRGLGGADSIRAKILVFYQTAGVPCFASKCSITWSCEISWENAKPISGQIAAHYTQLFNLEVVHCPLSVLGFLALILSPSRNTHPTCLRLAARSRRASDCSAGRPGVGRQSHRETQPHTIPPAGLPLYNLAIWSKTSAWWVPACIKAALMVSTFCCTDSGGGGGGVGVAFESADMAPTQAESGDKSVSWRQRQRTSF